MNMRTIEVESPWVNINAVAAVETVSEPGTQLKQRAAVYVNQADVAAANPLAFPKGRLDIKSKLDDLYGHLRNHVAPYNVFTESAVNPDTGKTHRVYQVCVLEVHAVTDITAVESGKFTIIASSGDPDRGKKDKPNVAPFQFQRTTSSADEALRALAERYQRLA